LLHCVRAKDCVREKSRSNVAIHVKTFNTVAAEKTRKGDERKAFMTSCLGKG
jgi:hypothetical protein